MEMMDGDGENTFCSEYNIKTEAIKACTFLTFTSRNWL